MNVSNAAKKEEQPAGIIPFVKEVAQYFMDFLETDFHKVKNPKRQVQNRNSNNLQVGISLQKYKKYNALVWKIIRSGFEDDSLNQLKRGRAYQSDSAIPAAAHSRPGGIDQPGRDR
jgi:hypothetical protein